MKRSLQTPSVICLAVVTLISGCSVLQEDKVNYKSATKGPGLEVPPDLTQLRRDSRYALESTSATASGFGSSTRTATDSAVAINALGDVRLERQGSQRWLVVNRPADKVWDTVREFWTSNGFALTTDAADLGILETDWAENRAKIPQDLIRRTLGKLVDGLFSSGERDRYRTRLERNSSGGVDIYISHRGMVEDFADAQKTRTVWKPRASDPELEIEFLRRLMIKLGASPEQAQKATALETAKPAASSATLTNAAGQAALVLNDPLDRAWRRTGLALDRTGFTVEDRDRAKGLYFVRYVPPSTGKPESGFLTRMFGSKPSTPALVRYQIELRAISPDSTQIRVLGQDGRVESSPSVENILKLLSAELR